MSEQLPGSSVSLETLLRVLDQAEWQAVALLATERSGSTHDVAEKVHLEVGRLADDVRDELKALKRWGVKP